MKISYFDNEISILESIKMNSKKLDILNNQEVFILKGYLTKDKKLNILMLDSHLMPENLLTKIQNIYEIKEINYPENHEVKTSFSDRYVEYSSNTATIFDLPKEFLEYYKTIFEYKIKEKNISKEKIMKEAEQFSFLIIDKYIDHLTSLPMNGLLYKLIGEREEDKAHLYEDKMINIKFNRIKEGEEIIFFDLNNLKSMNDIYGHNIADTMLIEYSKTLIEEFPKDKHFRIGGDEFISIVKSKEEAEKLIERTNSIEFSNKIKEKINEIHEIKIPEDLLIISSGGSETYNKNKNYKKTIKEAEDKMYVNKKILHLKYGVYDREKKILKNKLKTLKPLEEILNSEEYQKSTEEDKLKILNENPKIKEAM